MTGSETNRERRPSAPTCGASAPSPGSSRISRALARSTLRPSRRSTPPSMGARPGLGGGPGGAAAAVRVQLAFRGQLGRVPGTHRRPHARRRRRSAGHALASGEATWLVDAPEEWNFPALRDRARRAGWHAACGFPGCVPARRGRRHGVLLRGCARTDERLLATMSALGSQVGQFVARRRAEDAVRASESRLRAMLEAALDAVVTMDARGRPSAGTTPRRPSSAMSPARPSGPR